MVFGVGNVATQGVDYYGFIEGNYYPGGAPPWGIYDSKLHCTLLLARFSSSRGCCLFQLHDREVFGRGLTDTDTDM
jgi:hypothetical protein